MLFLQRAHTNFCIVLFGAFSLGPSFFSQMLFLRWETYDLRMWLQYKYESPVIARHNIIRDKLLYLSRRAFTSSSVYAEPLIHQGRTISEQ